MRSAEWALIIYTTLLQMAVGAFVVLGVLRILATRKAGAEEADRLGDRVLYAIGPVVVLGVLASFLHLGNPLNGYRALANVGTSWLSREILFTIAFSVLGAVYALMQWRKIGSPAIRSAVAVVTAVVGLALVFAMAKIYMLPTQPAWNTIATPVQFYATTLLLGSLAVGAALVANYAYLKSKGEGAGLKTQCGLVCNAIRWIVIVAAVVLGVELVAYPLYLATLAAGPAAAAQSAAILGGEFGLLLALRLALVIVGAGILGIFLYRRVRDGSVDTLPAALVYGAFALVLVGEVVGRFLFYASHTSIGI